MRAFKILISAFAFVMLTASFNTQASAGENQTDQWVIRLASDFSIIQSNIEEMIVHYNVSDRTSARLKLLEQNLRADVMKVITAANLGDDDTVRRYLPAVAREVQQQILVLTVNIDVTRDWAAARKQAQVLINEAKMVAPESFAIALAEVKL